MVQLFVAPGNTQVRDARQRRLRRCTTSADVPSRRDPRECAELILQRGIYELFLDFKSHFPESPGFVFLVLISWQLNQARAFVSPAATLWGSPSPASILLSPSSGLFWTESWSSSYLALCMSASFRNSLCLGFPGLPFPAASWFSSPEHSPCSPPAETGAQLRSMASFAETALDSLSLPKQTCPW